MADSVIKDHIETLRMKVADADSPDLMLHSAALKGAGNLTNGSRGDIEAMSDQLALMTAVIVGDRLNERNRHMAICPVAALTLRDKEGRSILPWASRDEIRDMLAAHGLKEEEDANYTSAEITLPVIGKIFKGRGKAAVVFMSFFGITAVLSLVIGGLLYWQSNRFADLVDKRFAAAEAQSATNNRSAVERAADIKDAIRVR